MLDPAMVFGSVRAKTPEIRCTRLARGELGLEPAHPNSGWGEEPLLFSSRVESMFHVNETVNQFNMTWYGPIDARFTKVAFLAVWRYLIESMSKNN